MVIRLLLLLLLPLIFGCDRQQPTPQVIADDAYQQFFGSPPIPTSGTAWVRIGFLPRSDGSGSLAPLPFFFYRDDSQLQLLLDQLTGDPMRLPPGSGLVNPFPAGSRSVTANRVAGKREINLVLPPGGETDLKAMEAVLVETAGRFPKIKQVLLTLNGGPWPGMPDGGFPFPSGRTIDPGPPHPLIALADLESGAEHQAELLVNFDRPVKIESFELKDDEGKVIGGDYFQSVFDMAVVVHPTNPHRLKVGKPLRVAWQASDAMGRAGSGEVVLPLQGRRH